MPINRFGVSLIVSSIIILILTLITLDLYGKTGQNIPLEGIGLWTLLILAGLTFFYGIFIIYRSLDSTSTMTNRDNGLVVNGTMRREDYFNRTRNGENQKNGILPLPTQLSQFPPSSNLSVPPPPYQSSFNSSSPSTPSSSSYLSTFSSSSSSSSAPYSFGNPASLEDLTR